MNCDLIIIGAGPGGYEVAAREAGAGKSVVIIEKEALGGTCLNRGCIPTKCLCAGADAIHHLDFLPDVGVDIEQTVRLSYAKAQERSKEVVRELGQGIETLLIKCTVVNGTARIQADGGVTANGEVYYAPQVIIATGSQPSRLPVTGAELAYTSDDFLKWTSLPDELLIIGGGVIGVEFAYIAASYGTRVTVVEYCKEILPSFDAETAKRLRLQLAGNGITFITSAAVKSLERAGDKTRVIYADKKGEQSIEVPAVLMAVGRRAVSPEGLGEAGIEVSSRGFIVTDDNMMTTRPGFYAVGDCNGRLMLAHVATAQSMIAIGRDVNLDVVPAVVFARPELAMVGLTTEQCKEKQIGYIAKKALYRANGKALASGENVGFVKILVDPETNIILGAHILGAHASDLVAEIALAMSQNLTAEAIKSTIHSHPSLTELLPMALD